MEKGINLTTNEFKIQLMKDISVTKLPPCIVRQVLSELLIEISDIEAQAIQNEQKEYEKELNKKNLSVNKKNLSVNRKEKN